MLSCLDPDLHAFFYVLYGFVFLGLPDVHAFVLIISMCESVCTLSTKGQMRLAQGQYGVPIRREYGYWLPRSA